MKEGDIVAIYCDLLHLVKKLNRVRDVEVYGYVVGAVERHPNLAHTIIPETCDCYKLEVLAIRFMNEDPFSGTGICNNKHMYLVNGSLSTVLEKRKVVEGEYFAFTGNIAQGVNSSQSNYLTLFNFKKFGDQWGIRPTPFDDIDIADWDRDGDIYKLLMIHMAEGYLPMPKEVRCLPEFSAYGCLLRDLVNQAMAEVNNTSDLNNSNEGLNNKEKENKLTNTNHHNSEKDYSNSNTDSYSTKTEIKSPKTQSNVAVAESGKSSVINPDFSVNIVNRDYIEEISPNFSIFNKAVNTAKERRTEYIDNIAKEYKFERTGEISDGLLFMLNRIREFWSYAPTNSSHTGRAIIKEYMNLSDVNVSIPYLGVPMENFILDNFSMVYTFIVEGTEVTEDKVAKNIIRSLFANRELLYAGLVAIVTGSDYNKMREICSLCSEADIDFEKVLFNNPYLLLIIGRCMNFNDVEHLAHCQGLTSNKELQEERNLCIIYNMTLDTSSPSTIYDIMDLVNNPVGFTVPDGRYKSIMSYGTYLSLKTKHNVITYMREDIDERKWSYPSTGWKGNFYHTLALGKDELNRAYKRFKQTGLGVEIVKNGKRWFTSSRLMERELFVYERLYDLCVEKYSHISHEDIDRWIDEFEAIKGFKLEQAQREAVHLVKWGVVVITGPAGSGKTTVSECIVFIIRKIKRLAKIEFAAPTGKAAKRLQEVVGCSVSTMHSKFQVFDNKSEMFDDDEDNDSGSTAPDAYVLDENAMVTIDLLYSVLKQIENSQVFFLGDICQLPPIGKGLPFKNMLAFIPCVALLVSKRASEGSSITYNSDLINNNSGKDNWKPLENGRDFSMITCSDDKISSVVLDVCAHYLGDKSKSAEYIASLIGCSADDVMKINITHPDDIQVVSPYATERYSWGTTKLNIELQNLFNPRKGITNYFLYRRSAGTPATEFRINDRVIHTNNNYTFQHYRSWKGGNLEKAWGSGVMNGDVGHVVGVLPSSSVNITDCTQPQPEDYTEPKHEIRDDSALISPDLYFIVVEYYDSVTGEDYYVLYHAIYHRDLSVEGEYVVGGRDLASIQLAYALTIHKMQGSQAKLIIFPIGTIRMQGFLTRNLLYTGVTRAIEGCYLIGNVSNSKVSSVSRARCLVAQNNIPTVTDVMLM